MVRESGRSLRAQQSKSRPPHGVDGGCLFSTLGPRNDADDGQRDSARKGGTGEKLRQEALLRFRERFLMDIPLRLSVRSKITL